jgi:hypothetical protein
MHSRQGLNLWVGGGANAIIFLPLFNVSGFALKEIILALRGLSV